MLTIPFRMWFGTCVNLKSNASIMEDETLTSLRYCFQVSVQLWLFRFNEANWDLFTQLHSSSSILLLGSVPKVNSGPTTLAGASGAICLSEIFHISCCIRSLISESSGSEHRHSRPSGKFCHGHRSDQVRLFLFTLVELLSRWFPSQ